MKYSVKNLLLTACAVVALGSCTVEGSVTINTDDYEYVQYLGFQSKKDSLWGLMNLDGEVLVKPTFKNEPLDVTQDRFFVQNADSLWELYSAEPEPKRIGNDQYVSVGAFQYGLCPVSKPHEGLMYINVNGEKVIDMATLDSKEVLAAFNFFDERARVQTTDGCQGIIDKQGTIIVKPEYDEVSNYRNGKAFVYKPLKPGQDKEEQEWAVIDTEGNELFSSTMGQMYPILDRFEDNGLAIVKTNGDEDKTYALIDETGEIVRNLTMDGVHDMRGDYIVFTMGNKYGMMNTDGEMLIKPSFDWVATSGGIIVASIDKAGQYLLFDQNAQEIKTLEGTEATVFGGFVIGHDKRFRLVQDNTDRLYDENGQQIATDADTEGFTQMEGNLAAYATSDKANAN